MIELWMYASLSMKEAWELLEMWQEILYLLELYASLPYVSQICLLSSTLVQGFFFSFIFRFPSTKTNICKFQCDNGYVILKESQFVDVLALKLIIFIMFILLISKALHVHVYPEFTK